MLILTRRSLESIMIGNAIKITVLGVHGNQVRFGIEAPADMSIDREEVVERKRKQGIPIGVRTLRQPPPELLPNVDGNVDPNYTPTGRTKEPYTPPYHVLPVKA